MAPHAQEEAVHVVEVLNQLTGEDGVETPLEIEILCVGHLNLVVQVLKLQDDRFIDVDAEVVGKALRQEAVQPVRLAIPGGAPDIEYRLAVEQRRHRVEAVPSDPAPQGCAPHLGCSGCPVVGPSEGTRTELWLELTVFGFTRGFTSLLLGSRLS